MTLKLEDVHYFERGEAENPKFFSRLGGLPPLAGMNVMDVGCGHGSLCIYVAERGAERVVGVDVDSERIQFAQENLQANYPHLVGKCEFRTCDICEVPDRDFDIIISKDSFEHIIDMKDCLGNIADRLKPGGRLYVGFGPLYRSPFGDHRRTGACIPWGHLIIPEHVLLRRMNRNLEKPVSSVCELGLNKLRIRDFERLFEESGLVVQLCGINVSRNPMLRLFALISRIPPLREYFSHNMYCVLRRPE